MKYNSKEGKDIMKKRTSRFIWSAEKERLSMKTYRIIDDPENGGYHPNPSISPRVLAMIIKQIRRGSPLATTESRVRAHQEGD